MNFLQGFGAGIGGLLEGYQGSVDRDMARKKLEEEQQYKQAILAIQQAQEADRVKQKLLEDEARDAVARRMQGTASPVGFQQGPTEPIQAPAMGLLSGNADPAAQFRDPRLAALMGTDQIARPTQQPVAKMGTVTPATFNDMMEVAAQYAGTPAAKAATDMAGTLNKNQMSEEKLANLKEMLVMRQDMQQKMAEAKNEVEREKIKAVYDAKILGYENALKLKSMPSISIRMGDGQGQEKPMSQKDYLNFQIKHSNAIKGVNEATNVFDSLQNDLAYVLDPKNKAAFDAQFGVTGLQYATKYHPQNANMRAALDRLQQAAETTGLQVVKANSGGIGAMTVQEWPKMSKAIANMSSWGTPDRARQNLEAFDNLVRTSNQNIRNSYDDAWANSPFYSPDKITKPKGSSANLQNDALAELARRRKK